MLNTTTFQQALQHIAPDFKTKTYLLAVSGGADSMVLLKLFSELDLKFEVSHVNYGLRGTDSDADEEIVEKTCKKLGIFLHVYHVSEKDQQPENSIQEWARDLRYNFFNKIKEERKLDFTVTAHHLNDELETFLINLSKASGIKGLSGIPANKNKILRPLLHFSKDDIYAFAEKNSVHYREDLSNHKNDYLRNFIRNGVTPQLLKINENFLENFGKSLQYLNQSADFIEENLDKISTEISVLENGKILLNKAEFFQQTGFVQFEILRHYNFNSKKEFAKILAAETGKKFISESHVLSVDRKDFIITTNAVEIEKDEEVILENEKKAAFIPEKIKTEIEKFGTFSWNFSSEKIKFPLKLRHAKKGDVFHPIGMIGKKKIAKFFKDEKLPILAQQKIWLLTDGKDDILGILPFRQDRRFAAKKSDAESFNIKI
ncbi:tRNA(Ile)-lysidine synthase [Kaistella treverensis]|uniref:tRNA(Ile)-lysidine synthase n=1 Tax=Kaistella treverensis TaxID=631455 RepID=A0A1I3MBC0_9FLAO|nr:tRNA lysidine(34) synthetase TilS [Kaistella treverensis]SFI94384.1 tRNA(Ile)-lysidine synthase [Kaistella treverensis]